MKTTNKVCLHPVPMQSSEQCLWSIRTTLFMFLRTGLWFPTICGASNILQSFTVRILDDVIGDVHEIITVNNKTNLWRRPHNILWKEWEKLPWEAFKLWLKLSILLVVSYQHQRNLYGEEIQKLFLCSLIAWVGELRNIAVGVRLRHHQAGDPRTREHSSSLQMLLMIVKLPDPCLDIWSSGPSSPCSVYSPWCCPAPPPT